MMKSLILKILLFILVVALVDFCFGKIMRYTLATTEKGDWGRRNYIIDKTNQGILVFGSSRAVHHYDPKILLDSFNMTSYNCAEDATGILVHYPRLKTILERCKPQLIIYDIIPKYDFLMYDNSSFLRFLRPYTELECVRQVIDDVDRKERIKLYSNLYKYNSIFGEIITQRFSSSTETSDKFTYSPLLSEINYEPKYDDLILEGNGVDEVKMKYFNEFVDLCRSKGIALFITASPWYKMKEQDAYEPIYKLCKEKNIPFLNHNFDDNYNLKEIYFHDHAHLNKYGAETYTKQIAHEIKRILNVQHKNIQ